MLFFALLFFETLVFFFLRETGFAAYFFLNLSTLPSVSISFCLPVKRGWHLLQMSTRIVSFVEPISNSAPHAQAAVTV